MNIAELSSFSLKDSARYRDRLNPDLWDSREQLRPQVKKKLSNLAEEYARASGILSNHIRDIAVVGSQASYSYTPTSNIDVVVFTDLSDTNSVFRELVQEQSKNFKKTLKIGESRVNVFISDINTSCTSQGIFSLITESWVQIPRRIPASPQDLSAVMLGSQLRSQIRESVKSNDSVTIDRLLNSISRLQTVSENYWGKFSSERVLLSQLVETAEYHSLQNKKQQMIRESREQLKAQYSFDLTYGYVSEDVSASPDGVAASTHMFLSETDPIDPAEIVKDFVAFCRDRLEMRGDTVLRIKRDPAWPARNKTFGHYNPNNNELTIALSGRHIMDILRTTAHELIHQRQFEIQDMPETAGETGSQWENEANAGAGILMRDYGRAHPEFFEIAPITGTEELDESASGYIPTKKQARDPRYSMALTVDIKPGALGKNANKLGLNTDSQGIPQVCRPDGKFKSQK